MGAALSEERLLAIIETQKQIAATKLDVDAVMELVVRRARELTGADAADFRRDRAGPGVQRRRC